MSGFVFELGDVEWTLDDEDPVLRSALIQAGVKALEAQALAGVSGDGTPLPRSKKTGQPIDLHETGRLWTDVSEDLPTTSAVFHAPYAEAVFAKYRADELSPRFDELRNTSIELVLTERLKISEE
jgi:hypothetical protein